MPDEEKEMEEEAEEQSIFDPPALKEPEGEMSNDTRSAQTYSSHATPSPEGDELSCKSPCMRSTPKCLY